MLARVLIVCITAPAIVFGVLFLAWNEHPNQTAANVLLFGYLGLAVALLVLPRVLRLPKWSRDEAYHRKLGHWWRDRRRSEDDRRAP